MDRVATFLTRTHARTRFGPSDVLTYIYLFAGTLLMFGPVLWLVISSFKTSTQLTEFPPRFLPYRQDTALVEGYTTALPLFNVKLPDGTLRKLAEVRRVGIEAQMVDPAAPATIIRVNISTLAPVESVYFGLDNYVEGLQGFNFLTYFRNSVVITVAATLLTLLINSMSAFALSKYHFRGRNAIFLITIGTLMIPLSVILIPVFLVITEVGWNNNLLGVIVPAAASPAGVFLLRQYMLTIPDELIDAARIDGASEWRIYLQIILPLTRPALAVLAIFSVMWRWNDFLWPLIVLSHNELFTLQVGLNSFQGQLQVQWNLILAMTVLTSIPVVVIFAFLQRYITTGIATTGLK
ncbi:MAG: carbohydrate ABC transporter permease [Aggregatilineales bacterium]